MLYGMMTQSHTTTTSSKKDVVVGSDSASLDGRELNNKSRVSSPISNSTSQLPQNSSSSAGPLSAVGPFLRHFQLSRFLLMYRCPLSIVGFGERRKKRRISSFFCQKMSSILLELCTSAFQAFGSHKKPHTI